MPRGPSKRKPKVRNQHTCQSHEQVQEDIVNEWTCPDISAFLEQLCQISWKETLLVFVQKGMEDDIGNNKK